MYEGIRDMLSTSSGTKLALVLVVLHHKLWILGLHINIAYFADSLVNGELLSIFLSMTRSMALSVSPVVFWNFLSCVVSLT